jgi:glycerophosphoryl diester phosphodiesterase
LRLDFGMKYGENFKGLTITTFEEILQKFASHAIMNIHAQIWDTDFEDKMDEIVSLIRKYDCDKHVYFTAKNIEKLTKAREKYPSIRLCVKQDAETPYEVVDTAIKLKAEKVEFEKAYCKQELINKAHENGLRCNLCYADDIDEVKNFLQAGIDCVLTNDYLAVKNALKK